MNEPMEQQQYFETRHLTQGRPHKHWVTAFFTRPRWPVEAEDLRIPAREGKKNSVGVSVSTDLPKLVYQKKIQRLRCH